MSKAIPLTSSLITSLLPSGTLMGKYLAPMDANEILTAGVYRLDRPDSEDPSLRSHYPTSASRAMIVVFQQATHFLIQLFVAQSTSVSYIRMKWASGGWSPWRQIT
ncbi:pyocin knob domain-containing protein [uncultured Duncaniella sp.]|uniref:pyocin knob domain-containing protein n=1 Tax=uncultured Duncaniella sp. TaxID=2768039 RepID=UPI002625B356|nr:pyocin knob domain-containing protein [uncultured Duncaniella sp.]